MGNEQTQMNYFGSKGFLVGVGGIFLSLASLLLVVVIVGGIIKLRSDNGVASSNTITVTGQGEAFAVPDIATISFTVQNEAKDVAAAQNKVTEISNGVIDAVKKAGVDEKDIQTSNYSANPHYEYQPKSTCVSDSRCPSERVLVGYEVQHSVTVKVRKIDDAGKMLGIIGGFKVSDINGPTLEIDNEDTVTAKARSEAIANAKAKASELAGELGVSLGKVVSFSEGGGGYPMMYESAKMMDYGGATAVAAPAPDIAVGQNKVTSNVTITYKIR